VDDYITRSEHEEFARRIDAEDERQNRRIALLEENGAHINALTVSIEKMAVSMENMLAEQKKMGERMDRQGERLEKIEMEPAEVHKQAKATVITAVISTVVGAAVTALLMVIKLGL